MSIKPVEYKTKVGTTKVSPRFSIGCMLTTRVYIDNETGYFNATRLFADYQEQMDDKEDESTLVCRISGTRARNWLSEGGKKHVDEHSKELLKSTDDLTKKYISSLSDEEKKTCAKYVLTSTDTKDHGKDFTNILKGTYIHRKLFIVFATFIDVKFGIKVSNIIDVYNTRLNLKDALLDGDITTEQYVAAENKHDDEDVTLEASIREKLESKIMRRDNKISNLKSLLEKKEKVIEKKDVKIDKLTTIVNNQTDKIDSLIITNTSQSTMLNKQAEKMDALMSEVKSGRNDISKLSYKLDTFLIKLSKTLLNPDVSKSNATCMIFALMRKDAKTNILNRHAGQYKTMNCIYNKYIENDECIDCNIYCNIPAAKEISGLILDEYKHGKLNGKVISTKSFDSMIVLANTAYENITKLSKEIE